MRQRSLLQICISLLKCEIYKIIQEQLLKICKKKRIWIRKWILKREEYGILNRLMTELALEEPQDYRNIMRMPGNKFEEYYNLVVPLIQRQDTYMRLVIPVKVKLEITVRFLAGGEYFKYLSSFHPRSTVCHRLSFMCIHTSTDNQ